MKTSVLNRARRYLAKCSPAISGQGGHKATFRLAAILVQGFALSEHDVLTLLTEWNVRCIPPWSKAELIHKVKSAANTTLPARMSRGYMVSDQDGFTTWGDV